MVRRLVRSVLVVFCAAYSFAAQPVSPRVVDLTSADGTKLKASYFAAAKPGPGLLLLHQCNRDRKMWDIIVPQLTAKGLNVLTLDFRGFGESGGAPMNSMPPQQAGNVQNQKFPQDVDAAYAYLISQPGVNKNVIGAAGASCGVNQSIQLARRHPEVKSLVLLSGTTDRDGRRFLRGAKQLPLFGAAADDDAGAVDAMEWILGTSPDPANKFQHYTNGGHGIELFAPHPELAGLIVDWFDTTLIKTPGRAPANPNQGFRQNSVMMVLDEPGGPAKVADQLAKAREKDPKAVLFPEALVNLLGYEYVQSGDNKMAIEVFKLNVTAYPDSPNTYDSLADAYAYDGQPELAIRNAKRAIQLLASDTKDSDQRKALIRQSAQEKLEQLGASQ